MGAVRALLVSLALAAMAGCESLPDHVLMYGAQGTEIQAQRLVAGIYGLPAEALPYGGPDIDRPLARMKARWPEVRAGLESGRLGLSEDGDVVVRDAAGLDRSAARALRGLAKTENRDRDVLYRAMTEAIGHNGEGVPRMQPFTEEVFGREWARQAPKSWWLQDVNGRWLQKNE